MKSLKINQYCPKMDILFFSIIPYNFHYYQRPQHIVNYFTENGYKVHYFNPNFNKIKVDITKIKKNLRMINLKSQNKHISEMLSIESLQEIYNQLDNYIIDTGIYDFFIFIEFPYWADVVEYLVGKYNIKVVFDVLDEFLGFHPGDNNLVNQLNNLVNKSDLLIATSEYLYKKVADILAKEKKEPLVSSTCSVNNKLHLIRNGTEFERFNKYASRNISKTMFKKELGFKDVAATIGYYGCLASWFDFDKVYYLAKNRPEYEVILIGNIEKETEQEIRRLKTLDNVKLLGHKDYKDLPKYLKIFDVAIIPFKSDLDLIKATNPVKFYEYLSLGKKIVATRIPELLKYENKFVYLSNENTKFTEYIDKCVQEKDILVSYDEKIKFAKTQSWNLRIKEIEELMLNLYEKASIIIVTYNNLKFTKKCVNSIFKRTMYPNYEIIIIDNKSNDGSKKYLTKLAKRYGNVKFIQNNENLGFAKANNIGLQQASGDYIVLLNNDTIVMHGWLSGFIRHLSKGRRIVGAVTNRIGNEAQINDCPKGNLKEIEQFAQKYVREHFNEEYRDIKVLAMFAFSMSRETFNSIGYLDERFNIGMFEDDDYSLRAKGEKFEIVCAEDVFIYHHGSASLSKVNKTIFREIFLKNKSLFESKWGIKWEVHKYRVADQRFFNNSNYKKGYNEHTHKIISLFGIKIKLNRSSRLEKKLWQHGQEIKQHGQEIKHLYKKKGRNLLFIGIDFRNSLFQRPQQMVLQMAKKQNNIFCISFSGLKKILYYRKNLYGLDLDINEQVSDNRSIRNLLKSNKKFKSYIVLYSSTSVIRLKEIMELKKKGNHIIYSYIDRISEQIFGATHTQDILEIFNNLEKIDPVLIIASAKNLYKEMLLRFPEKKVVLIPNGVEIENFSLDAAEIPKDMEKILHENKTIIGYYGAMAPWLDYELLNKLAAERPNYNFVYIGCDYNDSLHKLNKRSNVHFLGQKEYKELGEYSILFDVCTIPFCEGEIAKSTSPLKLFEYMAARKPVVVTKDLVECYGYEGVLVSKNHDDFINNIDRALELGRNENIKNKLFEYASQNTWAKRASIIVEKITEIEERL
ncbi:MAG: glycosyltransferase [Endomicrobium sp.]|jgi:GT2 family glycosyltransferase|uniref:glycosyltransferase n=1 Tax=Candidatus Endomicrobiellum cubanum TaxID=3242325 RepID=UPI00282319C2|nr:glycosyltransferase [Endomicrobium sp.]